MSNPKSTASIAGHPIHPMLIPFPIAFFVATFVCDLAYWQTSNAAWATAAIWLLGAGLIMAALAARGGQVAQNFAPKVGEKIPPDLELHGFPLLVIDKIPQVKTFKFFVTKDQIVLVSPQKTVADVIRRR